MPKETRSNKQTQQQPINIKEVIDTFCLLFHCHGYPKISAEVLRQSKFDQKEPVIPLLELIFEVLIKDIHHTTDGSNSRKFMLLLSVLKCLSYPRLHLLYCKELVFLSSRELLLAFGFLLLKLDILSRLRDVAENLLTDKFIDSCRPSPTKNHLSKVGSFKSLNGQVRAANLMGFYQRDLVSGALRLEKLLRKFNDIDKSGIEEGLRGEDGGDSTSSNSKHSACSSSATSMTKQRQQSSSYKQPSFASLAKAQSSRPSKINVLDLVFFGNLRLQESCTELVRKQVELLRLHAKWIQHECLFWKWLSSIVPTTDKHRRSADNSSEERSERVRSSTSSESCLIQDEPLDDIDDDCPGNLSRFVRYVARNSLLGNDFDCANTNSDPGESAEEDLHVLEESRKALSKLRTSIKNVEEENKKWLEHFLSHNFPNAIQLPDLKK